jgi:hypothetical protein
VFRSPCYAAYTIPFGNLGQHSDDLVFRRATAVEEGPFRFRERPSAGLAPIPLSTGLCPAELDYILLLFVLLFAVVSTGLIWTEVTHLGEL